MVRHMVLFRFRPETEAHARRTVLGKLAELPRQYPAMQRFGLGENVSGRDDTFSHVMTMEFAEHDELVSYLNSDGHEELVRIWFAPHVEARAIASYEMV